MRIGFALNEALLLLTALAALLALAWRMRRRRDRQARKPWWVEWGAEFLGVLLLVTGCRVALADWMVVPTGSMEPTVRVGDRLLINHLAYGPRLPFVNTAIPMGQPQRGDVVVFRSWRDASEFWVKRVIALPGDEVRFVHDVVAVNGEPLSAVMVGAGERPEDQGQFLLRERSAGREHLIKLNPAIGGRLPMVEGAPHCAQDAPDAWHCTVPPGHLLVMGDNRDNSADSRVYGFLPIKEVYGRADRVLVNFSEWSRFNIPL
jgi:signal peptidase I